MDATSSLHPLFLRNPEGLTVAQLKGHIASWPEVDEEGRPLRVYQQTTNGLAMATCEMTPLNLSLDGDGDGHLLLLSYTGYDGLGELPPG